MTESRIVVVGASGNVGTSVVDALDADPTVESVLAVASRLPTPQPRTSKTRWQRLDLRHDDPTDLFRDADVVIHLAWLFQPTHDPVTTWDTNVLGSIRTFEAAAAARVPTLVYGSSVGAYSPGPKDAPVAEDWPTHGWPGAAYPREKAYVERYLDAFETRHGQMRVVRMRPGFMFKRESASQQRRLFAGPLFPNALARPELAPIVPDLPGLRMQVLHTDDAADAYRRAAIQPVEGAFNLAAEPVVDATVLAGMFGARPVPVSSTPVRTALALAWSLHLVPASPDLFDAALRMPIMDTTRARDELGWSPRHSAQQTLHEFLRGLRHAQGRDTPPLTAELPHGRRDEFATGLGRRP